MIPPVGLFTSSDSSQHTADRSESNADPESLRHQRRPSTINRARRSLETIAESVNTLKGFLDGPPRIFDGDMVEVRLKPTVTLNIKAKKSMLLSGRNLVNTYHSNSLVPNNHRQL